MSGKISGVLIIVILSLTATVVIESYFLFGNNINTDQNSSSQEPTKTQQSVPTVTQQPNTSSQTSTATQEPTDPIPIPSAPEFTLEYVNNSRYVPPTYGIDPLTGKTVIKSSGYFSQDFRFIISIKNQQFTSSKDANGSYTSLFYNYRLKGHFEDYWRYANLYQGYYNASNADNTTITDSVNVYISGKIPDGSQIDFQVQAIIGHEYIVRAQGGFGYYYNDYKIAGETSDWSPIQTMTIS
jgi:hypothetical protein